MTEKIRIISCTKHRKKHYDYSELIGKEFNVKSEGSKYYILEGVKGVILKSDCQAIALLTGKQLTEADLIVGNRFECIEDLSTYKTGTIYTKGKVYECNKDGFITNDYTERNWFMPIEEINRHFIRAIKEEKMEILKQTDIAEVCEQVINATPSVWINSNGADETTCPFCHAKIYEAVGDIGELPHNNNCAYLIAKDLKTRYNGNTK